VYVVPAAVVLVIVVGLSVILVIAGSAQAGVHSSSKSLAAISLPFGSGRIYHVSVSAGADQRVVPVRVKDNQIWPEVKLAPGEKVTVIVTLRRPGWVSWISSKTDQVRLTGRTPDTKVRSTFITKHKQEPLVVRFASPVTYAAYQTADGHVSARSFRTPQTRLTVDESAAAGTTRVWSSARSWEKPASASVSWFPAGVKSVAILSPAAGTTVGSTAPITLTLSKPVSQVFGSRLPAVSPSGSGNWETVNSHTIRFVPTGYGYGLGAKVTVGLPDDVEISGGAKAASWTVPAGSTLRLQQLLAELGYLPVSFTESTPVADTAGAQEQAATNPPAGNFAWRYSATPSALKQLWQPSQWTELTKGAVMSFEQNNGLAVDGEAGPAVWKALMKAEIAGQKSSFGYTFVHVSETDPEQVLVWHNGNNVASGLVNTGVSAASTATGVYAVFEHIPLQTMSGTNPDGSTYHDPGIRWISYFNGGDALHGFVRASYGFPQSDGCVEMPYALAHTVWGYTPIGTIVDVVA
jgi:peptidoglycan hydrolase-like protein with peptidoglycan-binding domain